MTATVVRPNPQVFVWRPLIRIALLCLGLAIGAHLFLPLFTGADPGLWVWLAIAAVLTMGYGVHRVVAYRKTAYHFEAERLLVHTGGIASSSTIDLPYRNVTQVVLRLPWLSHKFFGTGQLTVHAAGSAKGAALLEAIDAPQRLYERMADALRQSGFSLSRSRQLQREKPHLIGTVLDTSGFAISGLVGLLFFSLTVADTIVDVLNLANYLELLDVLAGTFEGDQSDDQALAIRSTLGLVVVTLGGVLAGLARLAIHFIDLNRRTYILWDDVVDYEDGFLTETYKFIPIENLADTTTNEPFLKRLFGMANVVLRPHGAAGGISFPSMPRAARFRGHLTELIEAADRDEQIPRSDGQIDPDATGHIGVDRSADGAGAARRLPLVDGPPLEFSPAWFRRLITGFIDGIKLPAAVALFAALAYAAAWWTEFNPEHLDIDLDAFPPLDWIVFGGLGLAALYLLWHLAKAIFFCSTTSYAVGRRKISWERDFISRDEFEFTMDKITTLTVERDLIDRCTGCATLTFWSIGTDRPIVFADIANAKDRLEDIRHRLGLLADKDDADEVHRPQVTPFNYALGRLYTNIFWLVAAGAATGAASLWWPAGILLGPALLLLPLSHFIQQLIYHRFSRLDLFEDHLHSRQGILFLTDQYAAYDQLRSQITTRYPLQKSGNLSLLSGSQDQLNLPWLRQIEALHQTLDKRLYAHPMRPTDQADELPTQTISSRQPQSRNALIVAAILTVFTAWITVIPALLIIIWHRRATIDVEEGRVVQRHGLFYRTTQTVLINRIDQLLIDRKPLNTICRNGKVSVLTVGSRLPTLTLGPIADFQDLYEQLESRTQRHANDL